LPSRVIVALGALGVPVICWADAPGASDMHRRILDDDRKLAILTTTLSCDCRNETIFSPSRSLVGLPRVSMHFRSDLGADVRFGSKADLTTRYSDVCFTPKNGRSP
jgi:hypothetical protein